ncbi:MAG: PQQ-dependent sugar dehydrogenase [Opitutaceae bacterium]
MRKTYELPADIQHSELHPYRIEQVIDGLDVPWSLAFLPDGRLLFTERTGRIMIATQQDGRWLTTQPILDVHPVWVRDEAGLMALAVPPDYATTGWLYLTLSQKLR